LAKPWLTLKHACDTVTGANFVGDTISVGEGTFTETAQSALGVGVSIYGAGATSIFTAASNLNPMILLDSEAEGTDGNQSISYVRFDGNTLAVGSAIFVQQRDNVNIHHCEFENLHYNGVVFDGAIDTVPDTWPEDNLFHHNTVINCAYTYGGGLKIGGQKDMLVYDNTITLPDRGANAGFGIKYAQGGFVAGLKIYNNTITVPPKGTSTWEFAIEIWYIRGGVEVYNNTFKGTADFSGTNQGAYAINDSLNYGYALKVYNNTFGQDVNEGNTVRGIDLERSITGDVYIYNNSFNHVPIPIAFAPGAANDKIEHIYIYYNVMNNVGPSTAVANHGISIPGGATYTYHDIGIWNNTIVAKSSGSLPANGIRVENVINSDSISIKNNIIQGFENRGIYIASDVIDYVWLQNNISYGNGGSNAIDSTSTAMTHVTVANNLTSDPLFISASNLHLSSGSPAIDAGVAIGKSFITTDYDGNVVPSGLAPDIGVYEYASTPPPLEVTKYVVNDGKYQMYNGKLVIINR
jgi:hypothetical protein